MIGIEYEPEKVTRKAYKKLLKFEAGNESDDDSDDSVTMSQNDREVLSKYEEDDKELDGEEGKV
jgi:hypothetical protein